MNHEPNKKAGDAFRNELLSQNAGEVAAEVASKAEISIAAALLQAAQSARVTAEAMAGVSQAEHSFYSTARICGKLQMLPDQLRELAKRLDVRAKYSFDDQSFWTAESYAELIQHVVDERQRAVEATKKHEEQKTETR